MRDTIKISTGNARSDLIEFLYVLYKNKLPESRFMHGGEISFAKEASDTMTEDAVFLQIYDVAFKLFKLALKECDEEFIKSIADFEEKTGLNFREIFPEYSLLYTTIPHCPKCNYQMVGGAPHGPWNVQYECRRCGHIETH